MRYRKGVGPSEEIFIKGGRPDKTGETPKEKT